MSKLKKIERHVLVCTHKTCIKQGAKESIECFKKTLKKHDLKSNIALSEVDCLDQCGRGPVFVVYPDGVWYGSVDEDCVALIVEQHIEKNRIAKCAKILHEITG